MSLGWNRRMGDVMTISRRCFCLLVLLAVLPQTRAEDAKPIRILFIGNSYTAYNGGIYKLLPAMAEERGKKLVCEYTVQGGKGLDWHYDEGAALKRIGEGNWDYVVLQDHSLQAIERKELLFEYVRKLDAEIDRVGAKTMLYMTWARQHQPENQQAITEAYESVGKEVGAVVVPVGLVWQAWIKAHPDQPLHRADKSHPNANGTWITACTFYSVILKSSPVGLKPPTIKEQDLEPRTLSKDEAESMAKVAWEVSSSR